MSKIGFREHFTGTERDGTGWGTGREMAMETGTGNGNGNGMLDGNGLHSIQESVNEAGELVQWPVL